MQKLTLGLLSNALQAKIDDGNKYCDFYWRSHYRENVCCMLTNFQSLILWK
jgi:hypothetical protein